jgi:hypothetical protein
MYGNIPTAQHELKRKTKTGPYQIALLLCFHSKNGCFGRIVHSYCSQTQVCYTCACLFQRCGELRPGKTPRIFPRLSITIDRLHIRKANLASEPHIALLLITHFRRHRWSFRAQPTRPGDAGTTEVNLGNLISFTRWS